jgi:hypothetical protein
MLKLICPDCIIRMKETDLMDFCCHSVSLQVSLKEYICLQCGNSALQVSSIGDVTENSKLGRLETLEVTCLSEKQNKNISQKMLMSLIKEYLTKIVSDMCQKLFQASWIHKFEIILWDVIHKNDLNKLQYYEEFKEIKNIAYKLNTWTVRANSWNNLENTDNEYVSFNTWKWMHKNQKTLLRYDNTGNTEEDNKS